MCVLPQLTVIYAHTLDWGTTASTQHHHVHDKTFHIHDYCKVDRVYTQHTVIDPYTLKHTLVVNASSDSILLADAYESDMPFITWPCPALLSRSCNAVPFVVVHKLCDTT